MRKSKELQALKENGIIQQADTIEELCDGFVAVDIGLFGDKTKFYKTIEEARKDKTFLYDKLYGVIRTDKGLIYAAEMKGILPNGEIDWELL